ncbi:MAG: hypothetical protein ACO3UM_03400 [Planctomycetota bacterium]
MSTLWTGLWLLAVVGVTLGRAVSGDFVYDDLILVADNPALADPSDLVGLATRPLYGVEQGYWRPLTAMVLAWGKALGGAPLLHAIALVLHAFVAFEVAMLGRDLGLGPRVAAAWATLFAVHPAVVEPAAWIAAINDPLSVAAALLALRAHLGWRRQGAAGVPSAAFAWFACALLAKENALAILPVLLVLGPRARRVWGGYAAVLGSWALARVSVLGLGLAGESVDIEGLTGIRLEVAGRLLARIPWPGVGTPFDAPTAGGVAAAGGFAAVVGLAALAVRTRSLPLRMAATTGLAVVLPVAARVEALGPYPIADRYVYLAIAVAVPALAVFLVARRTERAALVVAGLLIGASVPCTLLRVGVWASPQALVEAGLQQRPTDPRLHCMAGEIAFGDFQRTGARADLERTRDAYLRAQQSLSVPLWNGPLAARVIEADVGLGLAYCALAAASSPDAVRAAVAAFERLVAAFPRFGNAWLGLGVARASSGRRFEARLAFEKAVELMPRSFEARVNLGRVLALDGESWRAREELEQAAALRPGDPRVTELLQGLSR